MASELNRVAAVRDQSIREAVEYRRPSSIVRCRSVQPDAFGRHGSVLTDSIVRSAHVAERSELLFVGSVKRRAVRVVFDCRASTWCMGRGGEGMGCVGAMQSSNERVRDALWNRARSTTAQFQLLACYRGRFCRHCAFRYLYVCLCVCVCVCVCVLRASRK
jgi:hypothetical protein